MEELLTAETVRHFRQYGWAKLGRIFDDQELAVARKALLAQTERDPGDSRHPEIKAQFRGGTNFRLKHDDLMPLVRKTGSMARQLVSADIRILWDSLFLKDPTSDGGRETAWHQDWPHTRGLDRRGMMSMWIALYDVPEDAGCLRFVPRSHRLGPLGRLDLENPDEYTLQDILRDDDFELIDDVVSVPLKAGEATVHDGLMLHGAGRNSSGNLRAGWVNVFTPATTRWNGAPFPNPHLNELGFQVLQVIDHPTLRID